MKSRNSVLIAAICLLTGLSGCKKFLNQEPITEVGPNFVFTDVASTQKALVGVYSRLTGDAGYGIRLSLYYPLDTDEMQGPTGAGDNDRRDIARYAATPGNTQLNNPFRQIFQGIEYANICIENIPKMNLYASGSDQQKKQLQRMYGEALTLRAQFYLEAIRNWGDLPANFRPAGFTAATNPLPAKVDRDTLYGQLLADLRVAEDLVPWRNEIAGIGDQVDERLTKGAVKGLRARIALYRGGYSLRQAGGMQRGSNYITYYQIARDECNDIITSGQHSLNPSFRSLWKDQVCARAIADPQGELMFQVSGIGLGATEDTKLGYYNGPRVNNLGNSSVNPMPTYFYLFDSTDTRRDVTIAPYNVAVDGATKIPQTLALLNDGKYRRDWITNPVISPTSNGQYFSLKWQILRYSDVLLMFAEAENELNGPTATAYTAINTVRRRGFGKPIGTPDASVDVAGLNKTSFFQALVKERALELGGEGIRKYDLIRWNLLGTAIAETKTNLQRLATATPMSQLTYMAGFPSYAVSASLPNAAYFFTNSTADNSSLWGNSFYQYAPFTNPTVTYNTQTGNYTLLPTDYGVIARGQTNIITLPSAVGKTGQIYWVRFTPNNPAATTTASWTYNMRVNTVNSEKIDGATATSLVYSGTVVAANPATVNGPASIRGFYSNGANWITLSSVTWLNANLAAAGTTSPYGRFATGFTSGKSELLPIPQQARDANSNLAQNPNY